MTTPINLNKVRKERAREKARAEAEENAAKFGLSKAQRAALKARAERLNKGLDQHKRDE